MKIFNGFFTSLKNCKTLNNFINGIKKVSSEVFHHLDVIFTVLFFIVKFVLPKIVLPKFLSFQTIPTLPSFNNFLFEDLFSPSAFQQETLLYLLLSQLAIRFTVKISILFVTAAFLMVVAIFFVCLYLNRSQSQIKQETRFAPLLKQNGFYTNKIQFLN